MVPCYLQQVDQIYRFSLESFRMTKIDKCYVLWQHNKQPEKFFIRLFAAETSISGYMKLDQLEVKVFNGL